MCYQTMGYPSGSKDCIWSTSKRRLSFRFCTLSREMNGKLEVLYHLLTGASPAQAGMSSPFLMTSCNVGSDVLGNPFSSTRPPSPSVLNAHVNENKRQQKTKRTSGLMLGKYGWGLHPDVRRRWARLTKDWLVQGRTNLRWLFSSGRPCSNLHVIQVEATISLTVVTSQRCSFTEVSDNIPANFAECFVVPQLERTNTTCASMGRPCPPNTCLQRHHPCVLYPPNDNNSNANNL